MNRLRDGCATLGGRLLYAPRAKTVLLLIAYGLFLLFLSRLLRLDSVLRPSGHCDTWLVALFETPFGPLGGARPSPSLCREVGFLAAPNWSITAVAIWPAMFFVLRSILDSADRVFADMDKSPMTWLADDSSPDGLSATWESNKRLLQSWVPVLLLVAVSLSLFDWWGESVRPVLWGVGGNDQDWSSVGGRWPPGQLLFCLLAFLYQAVAITVMLAFLAAVVMIARTVGVHGTGEAEPPLLVDIESNDPSNRAGFERFMVVIDHMILFVGLAFANYFLTRIQNAYLRYPFNPPAPTPEQPVEQPVNLWDFLRQDLSIPADREGIARLFDSSLADISSVAVAIGAVIALFQCFFFFNATLRHTAMMARNRSDHELVRGELADRARESGLDRDEVRRRLHAANVWPLGYSDLLPTLSFLAISVTTIVFYRIGVYLVFLWIAGWILSRTAAGLLRR